jgi:hypothetical protein
MTSLRVFDSHSDYDERQVLEELEALHAAILSIRSASGPIGAPSAEAELGAQSAIVPGSAPGQATRARRSMVLVAGAGAIAAVLLAFTVLRPRGSPADLPAPIAPVTAAAAPEAPVTARTPPVDPHPVRVDLTLGRRVWIRVTVDGSVALEREAAAGEQLHFGGDRSIVVRTGDAAGVGVRVNGIDQGPMGRDGQVLTRLFDAPAGR